MWPLRLVCIVLAVAGLSWGFAGAGATRRAAASPRAVLQPVTEFVFRRTERLHIEWPELKQLDARTARLLDRNGKPLALGVAVAEQSGKVFADLNLAPLAEGDYVIELNAGAGAQTEKQLIAFRVVR